MIAFSAYQEKNHPIDPVPTLIQLLQDQNEWVRRNAAIALGNIGMRNAVPALTQALQDEVVYVRYYTAEALGKIGTPEAINAKQQTTQTLTSKTSPKQEVGIEVNIFIIIPPLSPLYLCWF